jgi:hypothetical protein
LFFAKAKRIHLISGKKQVSTVNWFVAKAHLEEIAEWFRRFFNDNVRPVHQIGVYIRSLLCDRLTVILNGNQMPNFASVVRNPDDRHCHPSIMTCKVCPFERSMSKSDLMTRLKNQRLQNWHLLPLAD